MAHNLRPAQFLFNELHSHFNIDSFRQIAKIACFKKHAQREMDANFSPNLVGELTQQQGMPAMLEQAVRSPHPLPVNPKDSRPYPRQLDFRLSLRSCIGVY